MQIEPGTRTGEFRLGSDRLLTGGDGRSRISMEDPVLTPPYWLLRSTPRAEHARHIRARFKVGY